jgi:hypothetical protein
MEPSQGYNQNLLSGINFDPRASKAPFTRINVVVCNLKQSHDELRSHQDQFLGIIFYHYVASNQPGNQI